MISGAAQMIRGADDLPRERTHCVWQVWRTGDASNNEITPQR
jgi:hypothetical protein